MTARSPELPVQTAVFQLLTADTELTNQAGVHDYVPEDATYPYVEIGETTTTDDSAHDRFGRSQVFTVHVWSKHRGHSEVLTIGNRVIELLDHQPLTISGFDHIFTHFEFSQTLDDPDPLIRHGVYRFRITTEQTT